MLHEVSNLVKEIQRPGGGGDTSICRGHGDVPRARVYFLCSLSVYVFANFSYLFSLRDAFFLFIQNNKLQTQIQLQTWIDKKHRTGRNPLGCQKRVPYPEPDAVQPQW